MVNYQGKNSFIYFLNKLKEAFSKKVDKVDGKGLSTNDLTDELKQKILNAGDSSFSGNYSDLTGKPDKVSAFQNDAGYQNAMQVENIIIEKGYKTEEDIYKLINDSNKLEKEIVQVLPDVASAKENKIYMIAKSDGSGNDTYDEYMLINNSMELIGNSEVDLNGYYNETNLVEMTNTDIDTIWNTVFTE